VIERGVIDDAMAQKWPILHQAEHGLPPADKALDRRLTPRRGKANSIRSGKIVFGKIGRCLNAGRQMA
jgi:hypothetical protein